MPELFPQLIGQTTGQGRDHLDRYYTPSKLAHVLAQLVPIVPGQHCLEPHAGGGAFVEAMQARGGDVTAIDIDAKAPGLKAAELRLCADFLDWNVTDPRV